MGTHPYANITNFFPTVRSIHLEASRQECDIIYLDTRQFNPLIANALALVPAPHLKLITGYSGWPSPLATKLDAIKSWQKNSLRNAVEQEIVIATTSENKEPRKPLNYCHIGRARDGKYLVLEHLPSPG